MDNNTAITNFLQCFYDREDEVFMIERKGDFDPKDAWYKPFNPFEHKALKLLRFVKDNFIPITIIIGFGALILASQVSDARMNEVFYG